MDSRLNPYVEKMGKTLSNLEEEFKTIRAGRANPAVISKVRVSYYGSMVPISQVGNVTVPEARILQIAPWEPNMIKEVTKAINMADIGINPTTDGKVPGAYRGAQKGSDKGCQEEGRGREGGGAQHPPGRGQVFQEAEG